MIQRKPKAPKIRRKKTELQKLRKRADDIFRPWIKDRDNWTCLNCGRSKPYVIIDWSHFMSRDYWATRWDPDNCITLCRGCHRQWDKNKQCDYRRFMIERLGGEEAVDALERKAKSGEKRRVSVERFYKWYEGVKNENSNMGHNR